MRRLRIQLLTETNQSTPFEPPSVQSTRYLYIKKAPESSRALDVLFHFPAFLLGYITDLHQLIDGEHLQLLPLRQRHFGGHYGKRLEYLRRDADIQKLAVLFGGFGRHPDHVLRVYREDNLTKATVLYFNDQRLGDHSSPSFPTTTYIVPDLGVSGNISDHAADCHKDCQRAAAVAYKRQRHARQR